jgi:hypothetical protein
MSPLAQAQPQEVPSPEFLAKEAKDLLVYAVQEGTPKDVKAFYDSLDIEKILALIAVEGRDPTELPEEVIAQLLGDTREVVKKALKENPSFFQHSHFFSAKEWVEAHGLSHEEIVENGRNAVAHVLARVSNRELRPEEVEAVGNMARNIPDPRVIETILPLADRDRKIAMELVYNPSLNDSQAERLVDLALRLKAMDRKWINVIMELIVHHFDQLGPSALAKMAADAEAKVYLEIYSQPNVTSGNVIPMNKSVKKEAKTQGQRKQDRLTKRASHQTNTVGGGDADHLEEAVNM